MDPYKVLGLQPHASEKEIKEAYENTVSTYNLNDLQDDTMKSFYEEKLNEANEAYRIINHNMACEEVRELIDTDDFIAAETKLNMVADVSSAEWNYLKGVILLKKGWIDSGVSHIKKAATLNPYNSEYVNTMNNLTARVNSMKRNSKSSNAGLNICNNSSNSGNGGKNGLC